MDNTTNFIEKLNPRFNGALGLSEDGQAICVKRENLLDLLKAVKENCSHCMLIDITAAEYDDRFEVVYHIMDENGNLIRIKVGLEKEDASIPAVSSVWKSADVMEREIYDLMGIVFKGHSNLKRILCPDDFEGHPLRKDFKLVVAERL